MIKNDPVITNCFWFWNHCLTNRLHPRRPLKRETTIRKTYLCKRCGRESYSSNLCPDCVTMIANKSLAEDRRENQIKAIEMAQDYRSLLRNCAQRGTCDVIAAHHQMLSSDPERLSSQFLIKLICGKDYTPGSETRDVLDIRRRGRIK